ncbi:MAG: 50S ribosomal protein L32 [Parcubacteria group bacterium]|nr:50S ribosomal protein L32 [Parcubacteria group bacterium]
MSVRMRHTRSHTKNRRSHHALSTPRLSTCGNCGAAHLRHRMCGECGTYRGREVIDVVAQKERKIERAKDKAKSMGLDMKEAETKARKEEKVENKATVSGIKKPATQKSTAKKVVNKKTPAK